MRVLFIILLTFLTFSVEAQPDQNFNSIERKGFILGMGFGAGTLSLNTNDSVQVSFSTTLPNIKIGYMLNSRLAVLVLLPGANYKYLGKSRGFEGFILAGQYWVTNKCWVLGGMGLTFDAPAFYTVKDLAKAGFYTGLPAFSVGTGFEIWKKGRFALDLQYRLFYGKSDLPQKGLREGLSNMFIIGVNWY